MSGAGDTSRVPLHEVENLVPHPPQVLDPGQRYRALDQGHGVSEARVGGDVSHFGTNRVHQHADAYLSIPILAQPREGGLDRALPGRNIRLDPLEEAGDDS